MEPQAELTEEMRLALRAKAQESLYFFAKGVCGFDRLVPRIHGPICSLLSNYEVNTRLRILLPRGWYKTTLVSQAYPAWRAIRDSNVRSLLIQNTYSNAVAKLKVIDSIFTGNPILRLLFPEILPDSSCKWAAGDMCLKRPRQYSESTFEAAGTNTKVVSRHYNLIIEDDTVAPDRDNVNAQNMVPSHHDIELAIGMHRLMPPLLDQPSKDQLVVVGTRWYERDLLQWIKENERNYKSYERACREDSLGHPSIRGSCSFPERFGPDVLAELENSMGVYLFSCLYLNLPVASADMTFRKEWIKHYLEPPPHLVCYTTVDMSGDPAHAKKSSEQDYSVVLTCGKDLDTGLVYVLDYFHQRCTPGEHILALLNHVRLYHPVCVGIETGGYQNTFQYWLKEQMRLHNLFFLIEPLTHGGRSKELRIRGLQPMIASGSLLFRTHHQELISELESFPLGVHDDLIDALAMQQELWTATKTLEKARGITAYDPNSLDYAIDSIRKRQSKTDGLIFDVFKNRVLTGDPTFN